MHSAAASLLLTAFILKRETGGVTRYNSIVYDFYALVTRGTVNAKIDNLVIYVFIKSLVPLYHSDGMA